MRTQLVIAGLTALLLLSPTVAFGMPASPASAPGCSPFENAVGSCESERQKPGGGGGSNPGGGGSDRGSGGGSDRGRGGGSDRGGGGGGGSPAGPPGGCETVNLPSAGETAEVCAELDPPDAGPGGGGGGEAAPTPVVTEEDFQSFEIPPSTLHSWPDSWAVTNRRTAFWADASVRYIDLTLFDIPVRVRATPVAYAWDFGDGTTERTTSPGSRPRSVQDARIHHTYSEPGIVTVTLTTYYAGMYSVDGGPWLTIPGQAAVPSAPLELEVFRYHRFLVEEDCLDSPDSPDCSAPEG